MAKSGLAKPVSLVALDCAAHPANRFFPGLKGHRVSSCTHKERPLFHVNKKGRPVSQCQHCRGLRKSRAAHVKCVCAEHGIRKDDKPPGTISASRII